MCKAILEIFFINSKEIWIRCAFYQLAVRIVSSLLLCFFVCVCVRDFIPCTFAASLVEIEMDTRILSET
jgi:hypothetical protein